MASDPAKPARNRKSAAMARKSRGFLRAGALTSSAMKAAGGKRGFVEARLLTEWATIVGAEIAAFCRPVRVSYASRAPGLGAMLVVTAEGARAPEVDMHRRTIIDRVNAFYGYRAIARITIDQSRFQNIAADGQPETRNQPDAAPAKGVADDRLALALGRLEANIKRKAANPAPTRRRP